MAVGALEAVDDLGMGLVDGVLGHVDNPIPLERICQDSGKAFPLIEAVLNGSRSIGE
jgi:hypothetical protein